MEGDDSDETRYNVSLDYCGVRGNVLPVSGVFARRASRGTAAYLEPQARILGEGRGQSEIGGFG